MKFKITQQPRAVGKAGKLIWTEDKSDGEKVKDPTGQTSDRSQGET